VPPLVGSTRIPTTPPVKGSRGKQSRRWQRGHLAERIVLAKLVVAAVCVSGRNKLVAKPATDLERVKGTELLDSGLQLHWRIAAPTESLGLCWIQVREGRKQPRSDVAECMRFAW
jgi:hypothetical protein